MKALFLIIATGACLSAGAQSIFPYTAEGKDYYGVSHCVPGSVAAFYSSASGGALLGSRTVDGNGLATVSAGKSFHPEMLLNTGAGGNNHVAFTGARAFLINDITVRPVGTAATLSWQGAGGEGTAAFRIMRSTDGVHYTEASVLPALSATARLYTYTEAWDGASILYKIEVTSAGKEARYTTRALPLLPLSDIVIFPTTVQGEVYISLPQLASPATYHITSLDGKTIKSGTLTGIHTSIPASSLPAGAYIMSVVTETERKTTKIVKL